MTPPPLFVCRACRALPETGHRQSADGHRWTVCCTRCDRQASSTVSYDAARLEWNGGEEPPKPHTRAKLRFANCRNSDWHKNKKKEAAK